MNAISVLRCFVLGMYYCLDLALCISLRISYKRLKHGGQVVPSLHLASMAFALESFTVLYGFLHRFFIGDMAWLSYLYSFADLVIMSLFMMSFLALITSRYPRRNSIALVGLSIVIVFAVYLITNSILVFSILTAVWLFAISLIMLLRVRAFNKSLAFYYSNVDKHRMFWIVIVLFVMFWLYPFYWYVCISNDPDLPFIIYAVMQMAVYVLFAYNMTSQISDSLKHESARQEMADSLDAMDEDEEPLDEYRQTADTFFTKVQQRKMAEHMNKLMLSDRLYRNPELCVDDMVSRLGTNSSYFYYFMRDVMKSSFLDYVNGFRVNEAKELLTKGEKVDFIVSVVGYNSANSFRRAFKRTTGMTPTEWRQQSENGRQINHE